MTPGALKRLGIAFKACPATTCGCGCGGSKAPTPEPRPADLRQWLPSGDQGRVAQIAVREGVRRWDIKSEPSWRFFRQTKGKGGPYLADRAEIWIQTGLSAFDTASTALHELRHHRQHERHEPFDPIAEGEAEAYGQSLARVLQREGLL